MDKQNKNDNAANRKSYVGAIYNKGEKQIKDTVLRSIDPKWAALHAEGYIHIHDLDAYGLTYNCLTFDICKAFPYKQFSGSSDAETIIGVFDFLKELLAKMGNEQSGGMAFANFDNELADIFTDLKIDYINNKQLLCAAIRSFILWCNNIHTRMGQTSYYVTLNVGLAKNDFARFLAFSVVDEFEKAGVTIYKPNIVFKVHAGVSRYPSDPNFDLLQKSLLCTARKMIPTYLLCDCEADKNTLPEKLSVMGCRTRVVDDLFGELGAVGRGNIDNISINLPRLAFEAVFDCKSDSVAERVCLLKNKWTSIAETVSRILLDRFDKTCDSDKSLFPTNTEYRLWCKDFATDNLREIFKHGTLSIGFIGLSEAVEIITGKKYWQDDEAYRIALDFVRYMRSYTDGLRDKHRLNFSLLATSGELISGRFSESDKARFDHAVLNKGYYTNSFHIDVDSRLPAYRKIELEGPFHALTNGGCITYIELREAPIGNSEGMDELIEIAIGSGVHYLGFNFPQDVCKTCNTSGTFDICPKCGGDQITHIRRVSGYLEVQDYFTDGKIKESNNRRAN